MKGSGKILGYIVVVTCFMVLYVHLQVSSVIVSLEINKSSRHLATKQELYRRLQFNIDQLKAPRLLEEKMKTHELTLGLPNRVQTVEVPRVPELKLPIGQDAKASTAYVSTFSKFFGRLIQTAQAKTDALS